MRAGPRSRRPEPLGQRVWEVSVVDDEGAGDTDLTGRQPAVDAAGSLDQWSREAQGLRGSRSSLARAMTATRGTARSARHRADACPGALQTHTAADGELARVRVPGGTLTAAQLRVLADSARELGDGALELTSRGNLQLRGLAHGAARALGDRLAAANLLPSETHERVRNVLASVLSGRRGGLVDVRPWVAAFDAGLRADPQLAGLPGRFLATLDDGRGDVVGFGGDVGLLAVDPRTVTLTLAGRGTGLHVGQDDAVGLVLRASRALFAERAAQGGTAWRLGELTDGPRRVAERLGHRIDQPGAPYPAGPGGPVGVLAQDDGRTALAALVPLGRLTAAQADQLADLAPELQVTPWRSVVLPDLGDPSAADRLVSAGLVLDADSPWSRVTACAGRPGCAKSRADVRADVATAVDSDSLPAGGARQHWSGCERRCGRPPGDVVDVLATGTGYEIVRP